MTILSSLLIVLTIYVIFDTSCRYLLICYLIRTQQNLHLKHAVFAINRRICINDLIKIVIVVVAIASRVL